MAEAILPKYRSHHLGLRIVKNKSDLSFTNKVGVYNLYLKTILTITLIYFSYS